MTTTTGTNPTTRPAPSLSGDKWSFPISNEFIDARTTDLPAHLK
jgi:hypothetical protein